jgi:hypothetical protein
LKDQLHSSYNFSKLSYWYTFFLILLYSILTDIVVLSFLVNSGKWEDDKACGHGTLKYSNGDHYEGEWTDDQRNGKTSQV